MLMQEERELVVEYGKKMSAARLSTGTSGNISIYNAEKGLVALSPSGMDYFSTTPEDVVILDLDGKVVDGKRKPSSEWALHTMFYKHKPHARAVVHTHSVYCTTLAVLGEPIRAVHYVIGDAGAAEVPCAPYQLFGTEALAEAAMEVCGKSDGVLLGNHGLVCCGKDIKGAYGLACNLEYIAEIQCRAMSIGKPNVLTEEQMTDVMVKFQTGYAHALNYPLLVKYQGNMELIQNNIYHVNMPKVLRLSEQYLIRAEAYCRKGDYGKAAKDITTLRTARYSTYGTTVLTKDDWLDTISEERVRELYMEGFRLQDLKRWHKGFERKPQTSSVKEGSSLKINADNPLFVWPIPQHELNSPDSEIEPNESNR